MMAAQMAHKRELMHYVRMDVQIEKKRHEIQHKAWSYSLLYSVMLYYNGVGMLQ